MNRVSGLLVSTLLLAALTRAEAASFCVVDGAELRQALSTAAGNGESDRIRLRSGSFSVTTSSVAFYYFTSESFDLEISGGWVSVGPQPCLAQTGRADATVLSGSGVRQVLSLGGASGTSGNISVSNLTIRDGDSAQQGAGLNLGGIAGFVGDLSVSNVVFDGNVSATFGGGLTAGADGGVLKLINNLFLRNKCGSDYCAANLTVNAASASSYRAFFSYNTVVANICTPGAPPSCDTAGVRIGGSARSLFIGNAFAFNAGADLKLQNLTSDVYNNNVVDILGSPAASGGNLSLSNPLFVDPFSADYRLMFASPLRNAGSAAIGLPAVDLDGAPRLNDYQYDIGAFENQDHLFGSSFEPLL